MARSRVRLRITARCSRAGGGLSASQGGKFAGKEVELIYRDIGGSGPGGRPENRPRSAIDEVYEWFPRLTERKGNGGTQLSGGEEQFLTIARALLGKAKILFLDEPLEGLAPLIRLELFHAIKRLSASGDLTVVMIGQQVAEALVYSKRALVLERGQVVDKASAPALLSDEATLERLVGVDTH